jgi:fermentation-respiration switch protein FrsA (DUF1100 family)
MGGDAGEPMAKRSHSRWSQRAARMGRFFLAAAGVVSGVALAFAVALLLVTRWLVAHFSTLSPDRRRPMLKTPRDYGLTSKTVRVKAEDGLLLRGWYMPGDNGATVMVQHGTPGGRQDGLVEAAFFNKHGYNVLLGSFRAHDDCGGLLVSFGLHEMKDCRAWHTYLLQRQEVDPERIGIFGKSMGGTVAVHYAAENPSIAAVAAASAPADMASMLKHYLRSELHVPGWIVPVVAPLLIFWADRRIGCRAGQLGALPYAGQVSPRPLLIIQGGKDNHVPWQHGRLIFKAAGEPKEFWLVPEANHINFEQYRPAEYERRVLAFFDRYLLAKREATS